MPTCLAFRSVPLRNIPQALQHDITNIDVVPKLFPGDQSFSKRARKLGQEAMDLLGGGEGVTGSGEFASQIRRAKGAGRGVRVGVAEPVGFRAGGLRAPPPIGKGEAANRKRRRDGGVARHSESIANVHSIGK